jgi:hypothetical protein
MNSKLAFFSTQLFIAFSIIYPGVSFAQDQSFFLYDRGTGIPTSQFGTYIGKGELIIYPFYEYYNDKDFEYEPFEFGYGSKKELRGNYKAHEGVIFLGYGISDRLALELEAGIITAKLNKSSQDTSTMPPVLEESGLSDVEGQLRWRWNKESIDLPEFFNYFEFVFPTGKKNSLIGTSDWEFKLGTGLIKGFRWGTVTLRGAIDYITNEKKLEIGEYALEYLKRISSLFRIFVMVEGSEDEISLVPEIQWHINRNIILKLATGIGLTSKATDFAPELGIMFSVLL